MKMIGSERVEEVRQPDNPSREERHALLRRALEKACRPDDFGYIIRGFSPAPDITTIAPPGFFKNKRVGIAGGGLAGMAAAFELRKLGFDITIYDAPKDHIGGRVYTWYFNSEKTLYGELGAMRMPVSHETLWHYIDLFGLRTRPFIQTNPNGFIYLKQVRVRNDPDGREVMARIYPKYRLSDRERRTPWQELAFYGFERPLLHAPPAVRSEIIQVKPAYPPQALNWGGTDIRGILEGQFLSQGAINLLKNFLPLAGQNLYHSYIDYIQELYSADLSYLYEIPGGMATLPLAFYESFQNAVAWPDIPADLAGSVRWKRGCCVVGIYRDEDGGVVLAYRDGDGSERLFDSYDYVVCAIPFSTLRTVDISPLFSGRKMQAIREVSYINAQKTVMLCKDRFWERQGIFGGSSYTDLPISQIYYPSDGSSAFSRPPIGRPNASAAAPSDRLSAFSNAFGGKSGNHDSYGYHEGSNKEMPGANPGVLLASYNFSQDAVRLANMEPSLLFREIKREVEEVHGLRVGDLDGIAAGYKTVNWDEEPWFRGALCMYSPGQKRLFSMASIAPEYDGRVFFAGEHVSAKHRWMQGALKSGMEAANALAAACMAGSGKALASKGMR